MKAMKVKLSIWAKLKERGYLPESGAKILSATVSERAGRWFVGLSRNSPIRNPRTERSWAWTWE